MPKAKPAEINPAHEAEQIGHQLVREHHPHLADAQILYLFTSKNMRAKGGAVVLANVRLLDPLARFISRDGTATDGYDALVLVNQASWPALAPAQRRALIDHELCHLVRDDEGRLGLVGHDLEEFAVIVRRHGLWAPDIRHFAGAIQQAMLPLDVAPERELVAAG